MEKLLPKLQELTWIWARTDLQVCQINAVIKGPIMPRLLADVCDTLMSSMDDDSIRIIPKTWMPKKSGHRVDNVLKNHGFSQVSFNRLEGCRVPGLNSFSLSNLMCIF